MTGINQWKIISYSIKNASSKNIRFNITVIEEWLMIISKGYNLYADI